MLGPNLIRNPDCVLADGQWGSGSLGPDDWISFGGDSMIASQQCVITEAGDYKLILTYESDGWFKATVGDGGSHSIPAGEGSITLDYTITNPDFSGVMFQDRSESVTGRILHAELRKVTAAA